MRSIAKASSTVVRHSPAHRRRCRSTEKAFQLRLGHQKNQQIWHTHTLTHSHTPVHPRPMTFFFNSFWIIKKNDLIQFNSMLSWRRRVKRGGGGGGGARNVFREHVSAGLPKTDWREWPSVGPSQRCWGHVVAAPVEQAPGRTTTRCFSRDFHSFSSFYSDGFTIITSLLYQCQGFFRAVSEHFLRFQSSFRAFLNVLEQFRSSFRAVSVLDHFWSKIMAISEQFQSSFRAVSVLDQFWSNIRAVSEKFQSLISFGAIKEQFQSSLVLEQFQSNQVL